MGNEGNRRESAGSNPYEETRPFHEGSYKTADGVPEQHPERIGRYRIQKLLGQGGFGLVYLAEDEQLRREVAIKVPHRHLISCPDDAEAYLTEARTVASLDHPAIVPVHDVGTTDRYPCFVVSKYVPGTDLGRLIKQDSLDGTEAAELVATVAEALHYAHKQGLVHRDVKPGNILIDAEGKPHLVDFGLALREDNVGQGPNFAGTPSYMSPEQARGEGHRVDGRSDIFSLGVVFYYLLVGRKPFRGETRAELLYQITSLDPKPVRQYDEKLPGELERICHKALAKRATDRYSSGHDMAHDLRLFLADHEARNAPSSTVFDSTRRVEPASDSRSVSTPFGMVSSQGSPINIVPKGLRSFDAHDADFFLALLPGPRDRDGLPDSLRFWKQRVEEPDPDSTFSVGLIYGPSGCGKSSLVKAGLLPLLSHDVVPIYVEATPEETETRLLRGLRKRCPDIDTSLGLRDTLTMLRRGALIPSGRKILIVLDQFEQWLHAHQSDENTELVQALRQCDGARAQCIVMVRDDFWLAASRFLRELEVRLLEGHNIALVDLFDLDHSKKVLAAFGRAFGRLPDNPRHTMKEQKDFVDQAVNGLADEGKVICVRLALLAEMMKGKPWTAESLKQVGGTLGVGATFLEETFSASTASPEHRFHQKGARAVLQDLLPSSGADIKGHMRSRSELLEASGYANRPEDFEELLRILDSEVRLITPTDPEGKMAGDESVVSSSEAGEVYFQLTHDYLVQPLRDWLTRKQRETRQGRAELRLSNICELWNAKPENRFLPSWWEYLNIRASTDKKNWSESESTMMARAGRVHGARAALVLAGVAVLAVGGVLVRNAVNDRQQQIVEQMQEEQNDAEASRLVEGLLQADTRQVAATIAQLIEFRRWATDDLKQAFDESPVDSNAKLHAALALLPADQSVLPFLKDRLLQVAPRQFEAVRNLMDEYRSELVGDYWAIATDVHEDRTLRFSAASALATWDTSNQQWQDPGFCSFVASQLVSVLPSELLPWQNALRPVKDHLIAPLTSIFGDQSGNQSRGFAVDTLVDYLDGDTDALFDLLADSDEQTFGRIFKRLSRQSEPAKQLARRELDRSPGDEDDHEAKTRRQANAAVMLVRLGSGDEVWPLLRHRADPRLRTYIIHWLSALGCDPAEIVDQFREETDLSIRRALLLSLGEFDESSFTLADRRALLDPLLKAWQTDPDPGMHSAVDWLIRRWGFDDRVAEARKTISEQKPLLADRSRERGWYVDGLGLTFSVIDASGLNGSDDQSRRRLAISTTEITRAQWRTFADLQSSEVWSPDQKFLRLHMRTPDTPMIALSWYDGVWFCNWLSDQAGIPEEQWCYTPGADGLYGPGTTIKKNYEELAGYRLPTEVEWEFVARAGATTSRSYGESELLLTRYAWFNANSGDHPHGVALLKPNDFGLFDTLGNVEEWCLDVFEVEPEIPVFTPPERPDRILVPPDVRRMVRGGSYFKRPVNVHLNNRMGNRPDLRSTGNGIRPCRIILPHATASTN